MSMFDDVLGFGRTDFVNESVEPELENDALENTEPLVEGCDPMEFMIECAYQNELNMRSIDEAIMCEEYKYLRENGTEMIYEAGTFSNIVDKAKAAVLRVWNKIKKFIADQVRKFQDKSIDNFLSKYEDKAKKVGSIKIVGYPKAFAKANNLSSEYSVWFDGLVDFAAMLVDKANTASDKEEIKLDDKSERVKKVYAKDDKSKQYALFDTLDKKETFTADVNTAINVLKNYTKSKDALKTAYDKSKKAVDNQIKGLKALEKQAKKHKVIPTQLSRNYHIIIKEINNCSTMLAKLNREFVRFLNIVRAQAKAAVVTAAKQSGASEGSYTHSGSFIENAIIM